jgi:MoaA/NifB/PqqE/SkfB family radical SAM enzyme
LIKEIGYKRFSLKSHLDNLAAGGINACQLELTYGCGLRCGYCYVSGFNNAVSVKSECDAKGFKKILDKLKGANVLWLCFTGGDPLGYRDFIPLYRYARRLGFLVLIFTSGYLVTREHIRLFKKEPPFCIEITLNAVERGLYERISGVKGSFDRVMRAIESLHKENIPFKLKSMALKSNFGHLPKIGDYARRYGLRPDVDYFLHAGLRHELRPYSFSAPVERPKNAACPKSEPRVGLTNRLFDCNMAGADAIHVDPWGNIALCALLRVPKVNILRGDLKRSFEKLLDHYRKINHFTTASPCRGCRMRQECGWCPGKAYVETGCLEKPISFCRRTDLNL